MFKRHGNTTAVDQFEADVKSGKAAVHVMSKNGGHTGGGAFDLVSIGVLLLLLAGKFFQIKCGTHS